MTVVIVFQRCEGSAANDCIKLLSITSSVTAFALPL